MAAKIDFNNLVYQDDSDMLKGHILGLVAAGYALSRKSQFHLKIGPVNYYPTPSGKITIDPSHKHPETGIKALFELLKKLSETSLREKICYDDGTLGPEEY